MTSVTHTDPGDSCQTLEACETLLGVGKMTLRQHKLEFFFTELSKELEAHPVVEGVEIKKR